jgi:spermidine/putrescine transport system substrate-binding protein
MGDQRILKTILNAALAFGLMAGGGYLMVRKKTDAPVVLRVCTWSNYLTPEAVSGFEAQTGIKVELSFISSNEELFAKLRAGATGFDIIQPSDYMTRQMVRLGMLRELDHARLMNLGNLSLDARNPSYDPGLKHVLPFSWGTTGLVINTKKVNIPAGEQPGWGLLFESPDPHHTSLLDDMREVFAAMLIWKGFSPNSGDHGQLSAAKDTIRSIREKILMFTSEPRQYLSRDELHISHSYSMDALQVAAARGDFRYFIPHEGAVRWTDNFAIPSTAKHVAEAHRFLDYLLDGKVAAELATAGRFSTVNDAAKNWLPAEDRANPALYPDKETLGRLHYLEDIGDSLAVMNRMWAELKI